MKKHQFLTLCLVAVLLLAGCSNSEAPSISSGSSGESQASAEAEPLNLDGTWVQTNSNSEEDYQEALISGGTIEINWMGEDTKSVYWVGTYEPPAEATDTYSWTSTRDKEATDTALLASTDDTKEFTFSNGILSYEVTAMGTTMTAKLEKQ